MTDREQIIELTSQLGLRVDARERTALEQLLCDTLYLDYMSLKGGRPQRPAPADVIKGRRSMLHRLRVPQRLIANHVVTVGDDEARAATNVTRPNPAERHWRAPLGRRRALRARPAPHRARLADRGAEADGGVGDGQPADHAGRVSRRTPAARPPAAPADATPRPELQHKPRGAPCRE
jgi:hypothetical protein